VFHRFFVVAVTVLALGALLAPVPADAQPGHWRTEEEFLHATGPEWQPIAPGVYELRRDNGRVTQIGFGVESFRWALDEARAEQAELLGKAGTPGVEKELRANDELIAYLEDSLARAERDLTPEQARLSNKASLSGNTCNGTYALDVSFICGTSAGSTNSTASWSEAWPYAGYQKQLYTYARAASDTSQSATVNDDSDTSGPFTQGGYTQIQSDAGLYVFGPFLSGRAHVTITNGCSDLRLVYDNMQC
jgi:hypothetical protein